MNTTEESKRRGGFHYGFLVVLSCIFICGGPIALLLSCAGLFVAPVATTLKVGEGTVSYYIMFLWLAATLFLPLAARLFQKYDVRITTTAAALALVLGFVLQSLVVELWHYFACGFLMGLGVAVLMFLTTATLVNRWFEKRAGFFIGLAMSFTGIGGVAWNLVLGALINTYGWQSAYLATAAIAAVCSLPFTLFILRGFPSDKGVAPYGHTEQAKGEEPVVSSLTGIDAREAFRTPSFFFLIAFAFLISICMYGAMMTAPFMSSLPLAATAPLLAATVPALIMAGQTLGKIILGYLGDKSILGGVILALTLGVLGMLGYLFMNGSELALYVSGVCFGVFYALVNVALPLLTRKLFGTRDYVRVYARVSMAVSLGGILQAPLLGTTVDVTGEYSLMFLFIIALLLVSAFLAALALRNGKKLPEKFI